MLNKYLIVFLFNGIGFLAEGQIRIDSLFKIWNDPSAPDTTRLSAMQKIVWEAYLFNKPDSGFYYGQLQYDFAAGKGLKKQMADALHSQGISFAVRGSHYRALDYYQQSLRIREEIGDQKGIGTSLNVIGLVYLNQDDQPKAISYFERALDQFDKIHIRKEKASALGNIGSIYMDRGNYTKALDYFQKTLKIHEEFSDLRGQSQTLGQIGSVYLLQNKQEGLNYMQRAIHLSDSVTDKFWIARHLNKVGTIFEKRGRHAEAKTWCEKGLRVAENAGTLVQQKVSCKCLYEAYKGMRNSAKALEYYEKMVALGDSLRRDETIKKLQEMEFGKQMVVDSLKQAAQNVEIQYANEMVIRRKNLTRNVLAGAVGMLFLLSGGLYNRWRIITRAKRTIEEEKKRSENLLLNILPFEIAEELKEKGKSDPRDFEMVSVLFTDFIGFTQLAEKLTSRELVMEINACFKAFDAICDKYNIEKIKTIGDAYMAAGGLPVPTAGSVKNTILAALEMQEFIALRKIEKEKKGEVAFFMRLGIHTGPVVAGIVGVKKFQYDIWGDTVNTASRIESHGEAGKVNISGTTYELVRDQFICIPRGKFQAKGKGEITMYFVDNNFHPINQYLSN